MGCTPSKKNHVYMIESETVPHKPHMRNSVHLAQAIDEGSKIAGADRSSKRGSIRSIETLNNIPSSTGSSRGSKGGLRLVNCKRASVMQMDFTASCPELAVFDHIRFADESADLVAAKREVIWLSMPQVVGGPGDVDLEEFEPAKYINKWSRKSGVSMEADEAEVFNTTWRRMLVTSFEAMDHGMEELNEWMATGRTNGFCLRYQLMCLPPNTWFRVHAHPSLELITCMAGALHEVRLMNFVLPSAFLLDNEGEAVCPNLSKLSKTQKKTGLPFVWSRGTLGRGHFLANRIGSIHQSYTGPEGACLFLLWCGSHSNCKPKECTQVCDLLDPWAGSSDH
mmetsp:Transcript_59711/g.134602  ORF Transcript_59711/g.134602 Transcript_59711/m.134602 type:complete len:338 (+) Transcript_59711:102-1115(+)